MQDALVQMLQKHLLKMSIVNLELFKTENIYQTTIDLMM